VFVPGGGGTTVDLALAAWVKASVAIMTITPTNSRYNVLLLIDPSYRHHAGTSRPEQAKPRCCDAPVWSPP
jgi:hypothetical protein